MFDPELTRIFWAQWRSGRPRMQFHLPSTRCRRQGGHSCPWALGRLDSTADHQAALQRGKGPRGSSSSPPVAQDRQVLWTTWITFPPFHCFSIIIPGFQHFPTEFQLFYLSWGCYTVKSSILASTFLLHVQQV